MIIQTIYIACYKYDLRYTRILVASIRRWHPEARIQLIKDVLYGDFDTREIERIWDVSIFPTNGASFGWGLAKFEPLFLESNERCLILDSDIVFAGPLLDLLAQYEADFIVAKEFTPAGMIESHYYSLEELQKLDPTFIYPGFNFNTGQIVATAGLLKPDDFAPYLTDARPQKLRNPSVFKFGDQGLLNYVLARKAQAGKLTIEQCEFMAVPDPASPVRSRAFALDLEKMEAGTETYNFLIHWCGLKKRRMQEMSRADILLHFEEQYYSKVCCGACKRMSRVTLAHFEEIARSLARKALGREKL